MNRYLVYLCIALVGSVLPLAIARAHVCASWGNPGEIGRLDISKLPEASGLAVSPRFKRFYLHNDSGDGPFFYVVERDGRILRKVRIEGFKPRDVEEIMLGPCPVGGGTCLALADVGDNGRRRKSIEIVYIREVANFPSVVTPVARQQLKYPGRAHNAEAVALLPNGDLWIVTKEFKKKTPLPAFVYKAKSSAGSARLKLIGMINVPEILQTDKVEAIVTGMTVNHNATKFTLLTYLDAIEFSVDMQDERYLTAKDFAHRSNVVKLKSLEQQEAIAYDLDDQSLIYTSESEKGSPAPIMEVQCRD